MCLAGETLESYIALGNSGCQIDDKVFAGFSYNLTNFSEGGPLPDDVFVIPITIPFSPGLMFLPRVPWRGVGGTAQAAILGYSVEVLPGGRPIAGASLSFEPTVDLPFPQGQTMVTEIVCWNGCWELLVAHPGPPDELSIFSDAFTFAESTRLTVSTRILADGIVGGTAVVSSVTQQFREIPEPSTCLMLAGGVLACISGRVARQRRRRSH
jgi:hypothetical protein